MRAVLLSAAAVLLAALLGTGCDLFSARTPEPPTEAGGTFLQPDTPEQVIANVQAAIQELSPLNYRRSFAADLDVEPTPAALARDPSVWNGWGLTEEERYFSTLAAAAQFASGHELRFADDVLSIVDSERYVFDATYTLTVQHRRPNAPTTVAGTLTWTLTQAPDGLWRIQTWTDRSEGTAPSWSDLKVEFVQ